MIIFIFFLGEGFGCSAGTFGAGVEPALLTNGGQRHFGGGEKVYGFVVLDKLGHLGIADAGDEVADVFESGEGRHAAEIGGFGFQFGGVGVIVFGHGLVEGEIPDADAASYGGVFRRPVGRLRVAFFAGKFLKILDSPGCKFARIRGLFGGKFLRFGA